MPRTTATAVAKLIEWDQTLVPSLDPFIETANSVTTQACGAAGYDAPTLELIERWLSAHFYSTLDMKAAFEHASGQQGGVSTSYQYKVDIGLNATVYGQQAMRIDTKGKLAQIERTQKTGGVRKPSVLWLGVPRPGGC